LSTADELRKRVLSRQARIAVIGCGYVGLPLAVAFAEAGFPVTGIDVDERKIAALRSGTSYIPDISTERVAAQVREQRLTATSESGPLREADVVFVSVPTPFDRAKQPDLSYIISAAERIKEHLHPGQLVVLESTTFPGTTDEVLRPILERTGLRAGVDFYLAFSPERIDPGSRSYRIDNTPKVVGGVDAESTALAVLVLQQIITESKVHPVSSARVAEMTKLLENTFRAVNIALVNELAMLCDRMRLDIWEVIEAASTKPYGFMPFFPGPGVGGHCIPVDPYYLSAKAREYDFHTKFIELAAETNLVMPFFTANRIRRLLNQNGRPLTGAHILVLGAAFKKDIDDPRNSSAIRVIEILQNEGALVDYHDPFVPEIAVDKAQYGPERDTITLKRVPLDREGVAKADCVAILVGHSTVDYKMVMSNARLVFDAVNATAGTPESQTLERL
jgi:UDP-N-acetyl-D-glucosamine dehydrogenase